MMKKAIFVEHDTNKMSLIQGPETVIKNLIQLQFEYDNYLRDLFLNEDSHPYNTKDFVKFINEIVLKDEYQKVKILELDLLIDDRSIPHLKLW